MTNGVEANIAKFSLGGLNYFSCGADKAIVKRISQLEVAWVKCMNDVHRYEVLQVQVSVYKITVSQLREHADFIEREIVRLQDVLKSRGRIQ